MAGATLDELARGIHGAVTREDAKKLATLHGHKWKALLKRMKTLSRDLSFLERRAKTELTRRVGGTAVPAWIGAAAREAAAKYTPDGVEVLSGPTATDILRAADQIARYGGTPDYAIVDGVEVRRGS